MPTPFMHLHVAERLLADPAFDDNSRQFITAQRSAFLLGNVAPDARVSGGIARFMTHFFQCHSPHLPCAWEVMLNDFPALRRNGVDQSRSQIAFLAGYVAHLAMDVVFCREVVYPYMVAFYGDSPRYHQARLRLHILLSWLDMRDYARLPLKLGPVLRAAEPQRWLPFVPDAALAQWRDLVAEQLPPQGQSRTLTILGGRVNLSPDAMEQIVTSPARMRTDVWQHIPPAVVARTETAMFEQVRQDVARYLAV